MLEIFNDSDDSDDSLDDHKSNSLIKIDFLDENLMCSPNESIKNYYSNVHIKTNKVSAPARRLYTENSLLQPNNVKGRPRWDSGKLESKNSRDNSNYDSGRFICKPKNINSLL